MTEEVSGTMRLSVTIALLATMVATVANITVSSLLLMGNFRNSFVDAANASSTTTVYDLQHFSSIEAPNIYKVALESGDISKIEVILLDGSTLTFDFDDPDIDLTWFKRNAIKRFKVEVELRAGYELTLTEVSVN